MQMVSAAIGRRSGGESVSVRPTFTAMRAADAGRGRGVANASD